MFAGKVLEGDGGIGHPYALGMIFEIFARGKGHSGALLKNIENKGIGIKSLSLKGHEKGAGDGVSTIGKYALVAMEIGLVHVHASKVKRMKKEWVCLQHFTPLCCLYNNRCPAWNSF
jgi:hypothetical protein